MSEVLKEGGTGYTAAPYNVIAAGKTATAQTGIMAVSYTHLYIQLLSNPNILG